MASTRIGQALKAARARLGWSREALAYHSGVSWSAISQIESGRRKDVRLSSLSALADALGVSVDYLIGSSATPPPLLQHRVLAYGSDEDFLGAAVPFFTEGIEQSHYLLAVATESKRGLLRDGLDDRATHVEFADWADWYRSPQEVLGRYGAFVDQKLDAGAVWIRVCAEAAWAGETEAEIAEWTRYESLVNLAFASAPVTFVCTYDERSFPQDVIADARRTHPEIVQGETANASSTYRAPEDFLIDG
jgi:transcriptional regulator with XRE-family HTH domain